MMKFLYIFCRVDSGETDKYSIISQRVNGNFRFPSISQKKMLISLKFPCKNDRETLVLLAVKL